jgi:hypothetical protein
VRTIGFSPFLGNIAEASGLGLANAAAATRNSPNLYFGTTFLPSSFPSAFPNDNRRAFGRAAFFIGLLASFFSGLLSSIHRARACAHPTVERDAKDRSENSDIQS